MSKKTKKLFAGQIPFNENGELLNYTDGFLYFSYCLDYDPKTKILKRDNENSIDLNNYKIIEGPEKQEGWDKSEKYWWVKVEVVWKDNYKFEEKLKFGGFGRGRSAAHAFLIDKNNKEYVLFLTDLDAILKSGGIKNGYTDKLTWTFCKRGQNYGIMPVI